MSLLDDVSIVVTPNGYKAGELYAVLPVPTEGAEEVTNGDFATDTDWTFGGTSFSAGAILFDNANDNAFQGWSDTVNTLYKLTITKTGSGTLRFRSGFAGSAATKIEIPESGIIYFTSTSDTNRIQIYGDANSINATLNSVSIKEYTAADMDVTRATAATRVDEAGLVNFAEIVSDTELVTNGDFATDTDWTKGTGWTISGGNLNASNVNAVSTEQPGYTFVGKTFQVSYTISDYSQGSVQVYLGGAQSTSLKSANGTHTEIISISSGNTILYIYGISNFTGNIDNVSVKEVTRDNVPRIDYTGGGCPHILAEPQRINQLIYSEDFSQFNIIGTITLTTGQLAPDGTLGATKVSGTIGSSAIFEPSSSSATATRTIYAKTVSGTGTARLMSYFGNTSNNLFTLTEEWQRFELTGAAIASTNFYVDMRGTQTLSEFIIWGGQSEEGYATSYIPTSGITVTRNQDIFTRDGIGSLINSTEGVLFVEMAALANDGTNRYITLSDGSQSNSVRLYFLTTDNTIAVVIRKGGSSVVSESHTISDTLVFNKFAVKWKENDVAVWVNGTEVDTEFSFSSFSSNTLNKLSFARGDGSNNFFGKVKQLQVYKTALTDEQLIQLTGTAGTDFYESYAEMADALTYTIQ